MATQDKDGGLAAGDVMIGWKMKAIAFLFSQSVTMFGSSLVQCAIIWYIAKETSSGMMVTLVSVCAFLPQVLISPFAGVWADRHSRKVLIIAADAGIALATLVLAIIMMGEGDFLWALLVVILLRSLGAGIQMPAVNAMLPQLIPEDKLMKVSGISSSLQSMIGLLSPVVSGGILSWGPIYYVLLVDVVTAAVGISIFLMIPVGKHKRALQSEKAAYLGDLKEGIAYGFHNNFVRRILIIYMLFTVIIVPATFLNVLMVTRTFGDTYWHLTMNEVAFFIGVAGGGILIGTWGGFRNKVLTLAVGLGAFGVCTFAIGFIYSFWVYLGVSLLMGVSMPLAGSPIMVLLQQKVDPDMLGRVFSLIQIVASAFMLVGMGIFGPLSDMMPIQWLMIGTGIGLVALAIGVRCNKDFYREGAPEEIKPFNME